MNRERERKWEWRRRTRLATSLFLCCYDHCVFVKYVSTDIFLIKNTRRTCICMLLNIIYLKYSEKTKSEAGEWRRDEKQSAREKEVKGRQFYKWHDICSELIMMMTVINIKWLAFVSNWLWLYWPTPRWECVLVGVKQVIFEKEGVHAEVTAMGW